MADRGGDVALRRGQRLAVVERLELGELGAVGLDQLGERVDHPGPLRGRDLAQRPLEGLAGGADRPLDVGGAGVGDGDDRLPGRRVDALEGAPVRRRAALAADQQLERALVDEVAGGVGERLGGRGAHVGIVAGVLRRPPGRLRTRS